MEARWNGEKREREEVTSCSMPPECIINTATSYQIAAHSGPDVALFRR